MIAAEGLERTFAGRPAVQELSLRVEPGQVVGLLGPNGAGKTTTIRLLLGLLQPDAGAVSVDGPVGYLPESLAAYDGLAVATHLRFLARVKGATLADIVDAAERCDLLELMRRPVLRLSKGQRQRVGLAGALLGAPPVLVLDEPTQGLDPRQAVDARRIFRAEADRGAAVLVSTHLLSEASAVCDRVAIMVDGRIVDEGPPGDAGELEDRFLAAAGAAAAAEVGLTKRQRAAARRVQATASVATTQVPTDTDTDTDTVAAVEPRPDDVDGPGPVAAGNAADEVADTDPDRIATPATADAGPLHEPEAEPGGGDGADPVAPRPQGRRRAGPLTIAVKDLRVLGASGVPWVAGAVFHVVVGLLYVDQLGNRGQAVVQPLYPIAGFLLLAVASLVTMRSIADEARGGTLELLEAAHLPSLSLALGKWLAAWVTTVLLVAPLGLTVLLVSRWGDPDPGVVVAGFIGLGALSAAACAIGVLASSLTSSQPVAAALSFFVTALAWFSAAGPGGAGSPAARLSFSERLRSSAGGALDSADLGLFLVVTVVGVVGSWLALRARRLR